MSPRKHRVLVIDADPTVGPSIRVYLDTIGYDVQAVETAVDGLRDALEKPPSLILLAVTLPDRSGVEVFRELRSRARTAHIPIMFLADYGESKRNKDVLTAGADDFIPKPFDADLLGLRIRNAVQRSEREGLNHPRSGLPTGRLLQERIRALADEFGWYKIDFGIDNFDIFVERNGFMMGEEVVAFVAGLLNDVVQTAGTADDFIGQRDDTNFVIITRATKGPALRKTLEERFNTEVQSFYNFIEREQGFVELESTEGTVRKPLMAARIKFQEGEPED